MHPRPLVPRHASTVSEGAELRELDRLDIAVARREGAGVAIIDSDGKAIGGDGLRYSPTRDASQAMTLMDKYVRRMARVNHAPVTT